MLLVSLVACVGFNKKGLIMIDQIKYKLTLDINNQQMAVNIEIFPIHNETKQQFITRINEYVEDLQCGPDVQIVIKDENIIRIFPSVTTDWLIWNRKEWVNNKKFKEYIKDRFELVLLSHTKN